MESRIKQLTVERGFLKAALTRFKTFVETIDSTSVPIETLQLRIERINPLFDKFTTIQDEIESCVARTDAAEIHTNERIAFENTFFETVGAAKRIIQRASSTAQIPGSTHPLTPSPSFINTDTQPRIKLPTIALPIFDGAYDRWLRFRDTFESMIHTNDTLTNIERFHYLNSSLKGNAARVIQALGISDANYQLAWKALKDRYEDTKALKHHHLKGLFELQPIHKESHLALRQLLDDVKNGLLALKALGEPTDAWDSMMIYLISTKLDSTTKREWERRQADIAGTTALRHMTKFLEQYSRYLEKTATEKSNINRTSVRTGTLENKGRMNTSANLADTQPTCLACKGGHKIYVCDEFVKLSPADRITRIQQLRAYFNCLQVGHRNLDCEHGTCRKCGKKHHTLLHKNELITQPQDNTLEAQRQTQPGRSQACVAHANAMTTMLSTAVVDVVDHRGRKHECRALLDSGSQSHFLTEEMCNKLKLPRTPINVRVSGIAEISHGIRGTTRINLMSRYNGFKTTISCLTLPTLTEDMPNFPMDQSVLRTILSASTSRI